MTLPQIEFHGGALIHNLKAAHFHLFQDCYDWASEFRNVTISKINDLNKGISLFAVMKSPLTS